MRESSINRLYLFLLRLHYSMLINTWNSFEDWSTGLFGVLLCVCVCGGGVFFDGACCDIELFCHLEHMKQGCQESNIILQVFDFSRQCDRLLSWEPLYARLHSVLFGLRGGMVWGRKPLSITKKCSLALSPTHVHTFSLFLSAWMGSVLAASVNPAGMLEECERWVRDWERERLRKRDYVGSMSGII